MNLFELFVKIGVEDNASPAMKNTQKNSETLTNKIKVMSAQFDAAQKNVDKLTKEFNDSVEKTGATSKETQELAKKFDNAEKEADDLKNEMDSLSKKTKNAGDSVESLSEKLKKGLSTAAKVATGVLATVASSVVALGKIGLEYNAQIESYTTDFEVMMGDTEAAARKVEELKQMGAKTPFELGDLASATKTLLAFNVSADDSTGVLQQLGDISLGNVQKLESLTRAYGKMNASQKVTLEDINMMIDAGFNPLLIVAENTGETMEEVYDRISKGGVAFEEITGAINQATSEGGQFYQGMDKASQTTQGLISTLKDAAQSKIGELFSDISEKIKELLPNVISFIENIDTDEIVTGVENLIQAFNDLLPVITGVTAATVAYKAATSIAGIIDALRKATEGQTIAQTLLNAVMNANPFVLIATLIAGLVTAIITLWNTNDGFREAVTSAWEAIKEVFSVVVDAIVGFFTETIPAAFNTVVEFFTVTVPEAISSFVSSIGTFFTETIPAFFESFVQWFAELPEKIAYWLGFAIGKLISWGQEAVEWAITEIPKIIDNIVNFFAELPGNVWNWLVDTFTKLTQWGVNMQMKAIETGSNFLNSIVNFFKELPGNIWDWLVSTFTKITQWGMDMRDKAMEVGGNFINSIVNFVKELPGKIWAWLTETISKIGTFISDMATKIKTEVPKVINTFINFFKQLPGKILDIGKNIVDGLWNGIKNAWSSLTSKVSGLFGNLVSGIKKGLGIASPSKVFAAIGGYMAEGLGEGWEDEFGAVRDDIDKSLTFDDPSIDINASVRKIGAEVAGAAYGGTSIGNVTINIDGAKYSNENSLAEAIAEALQNMTDRRSAVYA